MYGRLVPYIPRESKMSATELYETERNRAENGEKPGFAKSYFCYMKCVGRHERSHASDALAENPSICDGVKNGTFVGTNNKSQYLSSEDKAHGIYKACLEDCAKTCPGGRVEKALKKENEEWPKKREELLLELLRY
jgi:hypothetical protein